jgi:aspartate/methionine/tyrosine aminotransferase
VPVAYPLLPGDGFVPDPEDVAARITSRTKVIVLNSPGNPTGTVFPAEIVRAIVELGARRGVWVLSDEVYDELVFEGTPANAAQYGPDGVVGVYSFSKTYAMTGWRVGYVAAPKALAALLGTVQEPLLSCISGVSQHAALAALQGPQQCVADMRESYRNRRDVLVGLLRAGGFEVVEPHGAFYQMLPLAPGADARLAALDLLGDGVSVAPGTAFGAVAADHFRLSLASSEPVLRQAVERILDWAGRTDRGAALSDGAGPGGAS